MNSAAIIVQEYLGSLKEDRELDYLFPILLNSMGFKIIQTAREAKGQPQYGKDIIAIGRDSNGVKHRWYFELKGYTDRDINDKNYCGEDGIRESILAAKDTAFNDSSVPEFDSLPIKIVLVHNGIIKPSLRVTFDGLIKREFEEGQFERWDIYHLTVLFSEYLFGEYLLSDEESIELLKKTLAFLDVPDYDYVDFRKLVNIQFEKVSEVRGRSLVKLFATLNLLEALIFHYSTLSNNLHTAKECSKYLLLRTWRWILNNKIERKQAIRNEFDKLIETQYRIFSAYFKKTYPVASIENGLYSEEGVFFESIGYPLRCFEYLDDMIYFARLREHIGKAKSDPNVRSRVRNKMKDLIMEVVDNNSVFFRPLLDNQSIPIMQLFVYFGEASSRRQIDVEFLVEYISQVVHSMAILKIKKGLLPEFYNNTEYLIEAMALGNKPEEYTDDSSMLIAVLLELCVIFKNKVIYSEIQKHLASGVNLQIPSIDHGAYNVEELLFEKHLHKEYHIEMLDDMGTDFDNFVGRFVDLKVTLAEYRTDRSGYSFVRYLAHSYFKNELLPEEWRIHL